MILAIAHMSPTVQAIFYALAVLVFLVVVAIHISKGALGEGGLIALGLALFVFVFFWEAMAS